MSIITFDLETLPSGPIIDPLSLKPPGNLKKPETIAEWYKNEAVDIAAEKYRATALDSMKGELLCIGYVLDDDELVKVIHADTEYETLCQFQEAVLDAMGQWSEPLTFVGWGIATFDVPWLWRAAIKYGLVGLRNAFNRDRYRGNAIDLMGIWGVDYKDWRKLDDVAKFLGLEGKTEGIDGSKVYDYFLAGRVDEIIEYCRQDVTVIREVYRKIYG